MNFTPVARPYFSYIDKRMRCASADAEKSQKRLLADLLSHSRTTEIGRKAGFDTIKSYRDFTERLPIVTYEDIRHDVMRMVNGERDILAPGRVDRYAQSSGTSDGKSKYIPLTQRSLKRCHYQGGADVVARYLANYPDSRLFAGKGFILGGSYANELDLRPGVMVGDLSASLIDRITPMARRFRVPSKDIALMERWDEKLPRLVEATLRADVTNLSGVPSWFMTVVRRVMDAANATELHDVWPNLEVFFHGGISFAPYREQYDRLIDPAKMRYMETYNASEGFFALQASPADTAMTLLLDTDVFYEFVPLDGLDTERRAALPIWEVETGRSYALVITSSNGLWRYMIGDVVKIESVDPVKITIAGRTKSFINAFGEELMVHNADAALARACAATGAQVADYTAGPVYADGRHRGCHQWLVEFISEPADIEEFADLLDGYLQDENSDYQAKRSGGIFLDRLRLRSLPRGTFDRYLASTGKLGGQRKVPRLKNDRSVVEAIERLTASDGDSRSINKK